MVKIFRSSTLADASIVVPKYLTSISKFLIITLYKSYFLVQIFFLSALRSTITGMSEFFTSYSNTYSTEFFSKCWLLFFHSDLFSASVDFYSLDSDIGRFINGCLTCKTIFTILTIFKGIFMTLIIILFYPSDKGIDFTLILYSIQPKKVPLKQMLK